MYTVMVYVSASGYSVGDITLRDERWHLMPVRYSLSFKHLRLQAGLTQAQLAEKVGVEQPTINRWENGKQRPDLADLDRLANALGVHPGELFVDDELGNQPEANETALREIVAVALRSGGMDASASAVRPLVRGLSLGLELLIRNPAMRSNVDALSAAVRAVSAPTPETTSPS